MSRHDLLDAFLCPFKILLHLFGRFHAIRKVRTAGFESALSKCLQFHKLAVLSIEFSRSRTCQHVITSLRRCLICHLAAIDNAHVCACLTTLLSNGSRFTLVLSFSLSSSTRSIPEELSQSLLLLPESEVKDGTAELAGVMRFGGETATRPYGAGYASGILEGALPEVATGRE